MLHSLPEIRSPGLGEASQVAVAVGAGIGVYWRLGAFLGVSLHCHMLTVGRRGFRTYAEKGCL